MIYIAREDFEVYTTETGFWRRPPERDEVDSATGKWKLVKKGMRVPDGILEHIKQHNPAWIMEVDESAVQEEKSTAEEEEDLWSMTKDELERFAKQFGVDLDKRKKKATLVKEVEALVNG